MRLIGEKSRDSCGGSLCELLVLMSVPSLRCEEPQWRCLKIQTTECLCLSDYWPCASPPPLILCLCFFCVFLPSHSDMRVKIWNPKMGKKRWSSSVWNDCYRWCLSGLIGRHNFRRPKPTLARSPGVSHLNPEGQFQGPARRRWDTQPFQPAANGVWCIRGMFRWSSEKLDVFKVPFWWNSIVCTMKCPPALPV